MESRFRRLHEHPGLRGRASECALLDDLVAAVRRGASRSLVLYQAPKSWAEKAYPNLIHYNKVDKGGHFAAWEQPQLLCEEVRAGFSSLR